MEDLEGIHGKWQVLPRAVAGGEVGFRESHAAKRLTATDRQQDQLVHELYGLTTEEIALAEDTAS